MLSGAAETHFSQAHAGAEVRCICGAAPRSMAYRAFGMRIRSQIRLQLPPDSCEPAAADPAWAVDIARGIISRCRELPFSIGAIRYGLGTPEGPGCPWLTVEVPGVARYEVLGNARITVESEKGADERRIGLFISGLILPIMLKRLPVVTLHGSAVVAGGEALAFIGCRGSGKSTTAAALARAGYSILCDDIIPVAEGPLVLPGIPRVKLLPDAFARLGGDLAAAGHLLDGAGKFQADLGGSSSSAPLRAIIVLEAGGSSPAPDHLVIEPVRGMEKIRTIMRHSTGIPGIDDEIEQFLRITRRLGDTPVVRMVRPRNTWCIDEILRYFSGGCR